MNGDDARHVPTMSWHENRIARPLKVGGRFDSRATKYESDLGFTTGIPRVHFSNTIPLPINTVTVAGEGMTPYMFGYSVIPKNMKILHCPSSRQPQDRRRRRAHPAAALTRVRMLVVPAVSRCVRARDERWGDRTTAQALRERAQAAMRQPREWVKRASWHLMTWYGKWGWA